MHSRFFWATLLSPFILIGLLIWWFDGDVHFKWTDIGEFWGWFGTRCDGALQTTERESAGTILRNLGLLIGGVEALIFALRRVKIADRDARASEGQTSVAQQSLLNERYQNGAEMLGSEVLSVRLGGIYTLQRLAEECPEQYHIQIMRLFCAFVRLPTKDQSLESGQMEIEPGTLLGIRPDVEAAMKAIGSRGKSRIALEQKDNFRLDLRGAKLPQA